MFRTLAILCVVAASAFAQKAPGLEVTYDMDPSTFGVTSFVKMPQTLKDACQLGYRRVKKPVVPAGYEKLVLKCPKDDHQTCLLYDDTGYIAGIQIALDAARVSNAIFSWKVAGFTKWTVTEKGRDVTYYTITQYFASPEFYAIDAATRVAKRDSSLLLQDDYISLVGFHGDTTNVPTKVDEMVKEGAYTVQACIPGMGKHYYLNMTKNLECREDTVACWFLLVDNNQLVGTGFMLPAKYTVEAGKRNPYEAPVRAAIQMIVPDAPECLYKYGDEPGVITMHTYFIQNGFQLSC